MKTIIEDGVTMIMSDDYDESLLKEEIKEEISTKDTLLVFYYKDHDKIKEISLNGNLLSLTGVNSLNEIRIEIDRELFLKISKEFFDYKRTYPFYMKKLVFSEQEISMGGSLVSWIFETTSFNTIICTFKS